MNRFLAIFSAVSFCLLFLTGCEDSQTFLQPQDTIIGSKKRNRPDWIDESKIYAEEGLAFRDDFTISGTDTSEEISDDDNDSASSTPIYHPDQETIANIFFDYDTSNIKPNERSKLAQAVEFLNDNPNSKILVVGHCDWHGTQEYNLALGDRRANSVQNYLAQLGADSSRIKTLSKGSLEATTHITSKECAQDRRSDVFFIK